MGWIGAEGCEVTFALWQSAHSRHHRPTSAAMPLHTNLEETKRLVALMPGWERLWIAENTFFFQLRGTSGLWRPEEESNHSCCCLTGVDWI